jgi:hypothetical protein
MTIPCAVIPVRTGQAMQVLQGNGEIIRALREIPKLQAFDKKDLRKILGCSQILKYAPGETISREEETDQRIYFIVSRKTGWPSRPSTTWSWPRYSPAGSRKRVTS